MFPWPPVHPPVELECGACHRRFEHSQNKPGPWPDYCSAKCRSRAHRRRQLGLPIDLEPTTRGRLQGDRVARQHGLEGQLARLAPPEAALVALAVPSCWLWEWAHTWLATDHARHLLAYLAWAAVFGGS